MCFSTSDFCHLRSSSFPLLSFALDFAFNLFTNKRQIEVCALRWKSFPFEYFDANQSQRAAQPKNSKKTMEEWENDSECNTPIHTQLFELCITDFTKSCHLSHRFFLLLQSVCAIVCVCVFVTFFAKNLEHVVTTLHQNRLHCFFTLARTPTWILIRCKWRNQHHAKTKYYHVINTSD